MRKGAHFSDLEMKQIISLWLTTNWTTAPNIVLKLWCSPKMQPHVFSGQLGYPLYGYKAAATCLPVIRTLTVIFRKHKTNYNYRGKHTQQEIRSWWLWNHHNLTKKAAWIRCTCHTESMFKDAGCRVRTGERVDLQRWILSVQRSGRKGMVKSSKEGP